RQGAPVLCPAPNLTVLMRCTTLWCMLWKFRIALFATGLLGVLALAACSVNQTIDIGEKGSGTFVLHAEISTLLRDYLVSLADLSGNTSPLKEGRVFDAPTLRKSFQ